MPGPRDSPDFCVLSLLASARGEAMMAIALVCVSGRRLRVVDDLWGEVPGWENLPKSCLRFDRLVRVGNTIRVVEDPGGNCPEGKTRNNVVDKYDLLRA